MAAVWHTCEHCGGEYTDGVNPFGRGENSSYCCQTQAHHWNACLRVPECEACLGAAMEPKALALAIAEINDALEDLWTHVKKLESAASSEPIDAINHPPHYTFSAIEVLDAIDAWGLGYHLGNTVKYVARAGHKGSPIEDLQKARFYLDRAIAIGTTKES